MVSLDILADNAVFRTSVSGCTKAESKKDEGQRWWGAHGGIYLQVQGGSAELFTVKTNQAQVLISYKENYKIKF